MTVAQGISIALKRVKQSALASPGSTGSRYMRRVTLEMNKTSQTYSSQELAAHQQSTGAIEGPSQIEGTLAGEISAGAYDLEFAALLRKDFAATSAITGLGLTVAGAGPTFTVTRGAGDFLTGGIKIGDVVRLSAGAMDAANLLKNMLVVGVTATILTVIPVNGVALAAEGPITGCTVTVIGKKAWVPTTSHTNDYFSWEKYFADLARSELFTDVKPASAAITIPATGIATVSIPMVGLGRTLGGSEVLTSPTAAATGQVLAAVQGKVVINGAVTAITGAQFTIDGVTSAGEPEVGSPTLSDLQRGRVSVAGSFTAKFSAITLQTLREAQTVVTLILMIADSSSGIADFVTFVMPAVKLFSDPADDGEKQIVRTYAFTAQYNATGGAALASHATIISVQDSLAA